MRVDKHQIDVSVAVEILFVDLLDVPVRDICVGAGVAESAEAEIVEAILRPHGCALRRVDGDSAMQAQARTTPRTSARCTDSEVRSWSSRSSLKSASVQGTRFLFGIGNCKG